MSVDAKITERLNALLELGQKVRGTRRSPSPGHITSDFVDVQLANQWLTSSLNLIQRVFGESSVHYQSLKKHFKDYPKWPDIDQSYGVLLSAKDDFENGALFEVKKLIEADLFDEFLEQAEHLLEANYYQASAVIAGSVLEDGLRKLCVGSAITLPDKPKLDWMNAQLAKSGAYNKLTQKKITALADLRNSAAHGNWNEFESSDVISMIKDVRDFMERNFA
ncbi:hypothetical protein [Candidatus Nitrotoga sp. M5]|uniref:hypothetical protein n=1 Tax=Candidatus Nitrotoga sp. M5 TaxID=2890409 RepID=UPI001EF324A4|nr:hypothetical protein [Candidatus Nitrotoga sp. M5]CAH1386370.1 HEPN domain-containing protein [Candidatus Nitrotoga sp. M5]